MATSAGWRSTGGDAVSYYDARLQRDYALAIEYDRAPQHGPVREGASILVGTAPAEPKLGVVFSRMVIVGGKVRLIETGERPNYHARNVREITTPVVPCLARAGMAG